MFNFNATSQVNSTYRFMQISFRQQIFSARLILAMGRASGVFLGFAFYQGVQMNIGGSEPAVIIQSTVGAG